MIEKHMWRPVSSISSAKPSPRWGHSCCVIGDELVLFGGYADSVYMNDVWVYHTGPMQWMEIKTFGAVPSQRSNSSFHYDQKHNRVIMFGGGGINKARFNTIYILDWSSKIWSEVKYSQNQIVPWERTYHSSQLLYPYLIVYGGEGVADLQDLWVYNLEQKKWMEIHPQHNTPRPCGRRFHSSCLIGKEFYVIAGCYSKYRPLGDVWSIDFEHLIGSGSTDKLRWKEVALKENSFLTRWGQACASLQNKIYVFGGRFSSDLSDVLVIDIDLKKVRTLKTSNQLQPKPRRRACVNFVGNCMLMFGGFNSEYFNDLHYINVTELWTKPKKYARNFVDYEKLINVKELADYQILTNEGEVVYCHKGILLQNFESEQSLYEFLNKIDKREQKQNVLKIMQMLYRGYGKLNEFKCYCQNLPETKEQKQLIFLKNIEKLKDNQIVNQVFFQRKTLLKIINNNNIELSDTEFQEFLQRNRQNTYKDIQLIINNMYTIKSNSVLLQFNSKFFANMLNSKYCQYQQQSENGTKIIQLTIPTGNIVLLEIVLNFLMLGFVIIPESMSHQSWIQLYELADYFALMELKKIAMYCICCKIDENTVDTILQFSTVYQLHELALCCGQYKIKNTDGESQIYENKYIKEVYIQNKFEIKQKIIAKQVSLEFKQKISTSSSIQGEKQNFQIYNQ